MDKVPVTCPNCEEEFFVARNAKKGKCPFCNILLKYEDIEIIREETMEKEVFEEKVDITFIEKMVDAMCEEKKIRQPHHIADIVVIETIHPEMHYNLIEKEVDKIIKSKKV